MTKFCDSRARFYFVTTRWLEPYIILCSIRVAVELNKRREIRQSSSGPSICRFYDKNVRQSGTNRIFGVKKIQEKNGKNY